MCRYSGSFCCFRPKLWCSSRTAWIGAIVDSSRGMPMLAHNVNIVLKKTSDYALLNIFHKALALVKTCEIQAIQLRTLNFGSIIC